jgi:hypothetical protein
MEFSESRPDAPLDGTIEDINDIPGDGDEKIVAYWSQQLDLSRQVLKEWHKSAGNTVEKYMGSGPSRKSHQHNILWSNTETLRPALYNSTPKPDVRRRFRDADPVGKQVSEALERALSYTLDAYDFGHVIDRAVLDYVLPGRPVVRVRYKPHYETIPQSKEFLDPGNYPEGMQLPEGAELDEERDLHFMLHPEKKLLSYEEVTCETVDWDRFLHDPARSWDEVDWIAFEHHLTRDELKENFKNGPAGEDLETMTLTLEVDDQQSDGQKETDLFKKMQVFEIWSKLDKKIYFIAESYKDSPLKVEDDNLNLKGFYPCPPPIYAVESTTNLIPTCEFTLYKDQADELDRVTARINKLMLGLRLVGIYDGTIPEMDKLKNAAENELIAAENVNRLNDIGGLAKAVFFWPIEQASAVLVNLYNQRDQLKELIYEITGISDIMRGSTDPRETKGAQAIKANWGGQRIQRRQKAVESYIRDIVRIKAEIIAEKFSPKTLKLMTGREITPEMVEIMRSDALREFRVDIETDSTIAATAQEDQKETVSFLKGFTEFVTGLGPSVQAGYITAKAAKAMALAASRRFKFGREVEDALNEMDAEKADQGEKKPSAEEQKAQMEGQKMEMEMQGKQADMQMKQQEGQMKQQEARLKIQAQQQELQMKQQAQEQEMNMKQAAYQTEADLKREAAQEASRLAGMEMERKMALMEREMERKLEIEREKASANIDIAQYTARNKPQPTNGKK